jgi:predicted nucleic acid-binding protein
MIVVDASAVLETLLRSSSPSAVEKVILDPRQTLHAPHLLDVEVAHVIRRYASLGDIDEDRSRTALNHLGQLPLRRYPHTFLLPRVWELRHNLTAYDATYVALAEVLDATLLTRDRRLASAAGHSARIELV